MDATESPPTPAPQDAEQSAPTEAPKDQAVSFLVPAAGPELVIGLVGPVGVELDPIVEVLAEVLAEPGYRTKKVHLSKLIQGFMDVTPDWDSVHGRIASLMTAGSKLREVTGRGDAAALLGIAEISRLREEELDGEAERNAFILRSLKHPEEVQTLRSIYGKGFILISVYSPRDTRVSALADRIGSDVYGNKHQARSLAEELVARDEAEEGKAFGQDVKDAFPLADMFVDGRSGDALRIQLTRFLELFFGNRFHTPSSDEHGMYLARAAALRSADLNRQVGAAIMNKGGDVIAVGCNDVPKAGGDQYWPGDPNDARDFKYGFDSSASQREFMLGELLGRLKTNKLLAETVKPGDITDLVRSLISGDKKDFLKGAAFMNLLEFGRSVHAEMAALMSAVRLGLSVKGATLFCTTFPCHMCARHIVASGIDRVVYVEPYPKSRAKQLHQDSISVDPVWSSHAHVNFEPFNGVAPRQYIDIFEAGDRRKDKQGRAAVWRLSAGQPRFSRFLSTYLELEEKVTGEAIPALRSKLVSLKNPIDPQPTQESI